MAQIPGFPLTTVISQYANSPTLLTLIDAIFSAVDPEKDFNTFYDYVWNVSTAKGFGLDIWGKIVNVSRSLNIPQDPFFLGFAEPKAELQPFGQAPFYAGKVDASVYNLTDDAYRVLILAKAFANISDSSAKSINRLLKMLFPGRGRTYVQDLGGMKMRYIFEFPLTPFEIAIVTQSGALIRPAAVLTRALVVMPKETFGFAEAQDYQPFGSGILFNATTGSFNAN